MSSADPGDRRRPPPPIPVLVLTGFLGAGKTTVLNRWVKSPSLAHAVVIINEFGDVPIDHLLVEQSDEALFTLPSGCICCTARGDLLATFEDLIRRRDNGRIAPFDRIVVETTGLADPAPILNAVVVHPYLSLRYRIDLVVTVVDALNGIRTLDEHDQARVQVAVADLLLISKSDLVDDGSREVIGRRLAEINPIAPVSDVNATASGIESVLEISVPRLSREQPLDELSPILDPPISFGHPSAFEASDIDTFSLVSRTTLDPIAFEMFVDLLRGSVGDKLLRVKGIVALRNDPTRPLVIHGVQRFFHPPRRLENWPDRDHRSRLVFIVRDLDRLVVERLWSALFEGPQIDRPDADALLQALPGHAGLLG